MLMPKKRSTQSYVVIMAFHPVPLFILYLSLEISTRKESGSLRYKCKPYIKLMFQNGILKLEFFLKSSVFIPWREISKGKKVDISETNATYQFKLRF